MIIIPVITREMMAPCKKCVVGYDPLHSECYSCSKAPGRKNNFKSKEEERC